MALNNTIEKCKDIFYGLTRDSTAAYSIVVVNDEQEITINATNGNGMHAEINLLHLFPTKIKLQDLKDKEVRITIMLSRSPCWKCREDLESYFELLKKNRTRVIFTLRIASIYHGDHEGGKEIDNLLLAKWFFQLYIDETVAEQIIEPINVTTEIHMDTEQSIIENRAKIDKQIASNVKVVQTMYEVLRNPYERKLITNLALVKEEKSLSGEVKRTFYKSTRENEAEAEAVAVVQIRINAKNTADKSKEKIFRPIIRQTDKGCCDLLNKVVKELSSNKQYKKLFRCIKDCIPTSWEIQSTEMLLALTHWPCPECIQQLCNYVLKYDMHLMLRIANIPRKKEPQIVNVLCHPFSLKFRIQLQAIAVVEELGRVNCRQGADEEEKEEWESTKTERRALDIKVTTIVQQINEKVENYKEKFERLSHIPAYTENFIEAFERLSLIYIEE